jgi:hypothetical protein
MWPALHEMGRSIEYDSPEKIHDIGDARQQFRETCGKLPDETILTQTELAALVPQIKAMWENYNPNSIAPSETPTRIYDMMLTIVK